MRHKLILFCLVFCFVNTYSQKKSYSIRILNKENTTNPLYEKGLQGFYDFISDNLAFGHVTENISEIITMRFTIDTQGNVIDIKTVKDSQKSIFKFGKQIQRVLKKSPKWIPGKINDVVAPVTLEIDIPINIKMDHYIDEY